MLDTIKLGEKENKIDFESRRGKTWILCLENETFELAFACWRHRGKSDTSVL